MPVDRSIHAERTSGNCARAASTLPPCRRKTSDAIAAAVIARVRGSVGEPDACVTGLIRCAVAEDRLVLLVRQILDARLQLEVVGERIGDAQVHDVVACHAVGVRGVVEARTDVRQRRAGVEAEWPAVVEHGTQRFARPAREIIAERRATLGAIDRLHIAVVELRSEGFDGLEHRRQLHAGGARPRYVVVRTEGTVRADAVERNIARYEVDEVVRLSLERADGELDLSPSTRCVTPASKPRALSGRRSRLPNSLCS